MKISVQRHLPTRWDQSESNQPRYFQTPFLRRLREWHKSGRLVHFTKPYLLRGSLVLSSHFFDKIFEQFGFWKRLIRLSSLIAKTEYNYLVNKKVHKYVLMRSIFLWIFVLSLNYLRTQSNKSFLRAEFFWNIKDLSSHPI